ncbi:acetyltransferase [Aurantibacter crassamenti]|uniref:acetyltransferase n=1 Tax=Aurantibacter crassamenti TaxID=1837375 RepID=UPI00193A459F|nr:acetyltransferase [Aurantibacter crassamenti]MBM1105897.1 acetyltransferase [Aurantibacter crassamenti]
MKNIVIIGASGHGNVVLDIIENEAKYNVIGFIDTYKEKCRLAIGYEVLGSEEELPYLMDKFNFSEGIIAIGDNWTRKKVVDKISKIVPKFRYISSVHPNAVIGRDVKIGLGTIVMPGAIVNSNANIGNFCILNTNSSLDHDSEIGDYSSLAPRASTGGHVRLGEFSAICLGANIIEGIHIGEHTVIGAGSLVVNNVKSFVMAYGSPSQVIRERAIGDPYLSKGKDAKSELVVIHKNEIQTSI